MLAELVTLFWFDRLYTFTINSFVPSMRADYLNLLFYASDVQNAPARRLAHVRHLASFQIVQFQSLCFPSSLCCPMLKCWPSGKQLLARIFTLDVLGRLE